MNVSAIIAEYNPFHNGHKYHIEQTKRLTDNSFVMVIMSGNFVQRGEPAIIEKRERAKMAVAAGADLVVELPVPWATASAERFAKGAVYIAAQAGIVNYLSFGCETQDTQALSQIARILNDKVYSREIKNYYDDKMCSYAQARTAVVNEVLGKDCSEIMLKPNNILAIEYIRALQSLKSPIKPLGIARQSVEHDSHILSGSMTSAMNIRNLIKTGRDYKVFVPQSTYDILNCADNADKFPSLYSRLETAVLADLRKKSPADFAFVSDIAEGIEHRILDAVNSSVTLNEVFDKVKTKRYAHARIRRIILSSFLGITESDVNSLPPYIRVLALNDNGRQMLKEMKSKYFFPVVMKYGDVKYLDNNAKNIFMKESVATDIYNLSLPQNRPCGTDMTDEIIYLP
ncbi:MAG: nucleotidyltransferase family protein [Clostridia bacterium]|nr:nucleotidyltransferase family protein [Clostridia bacterium]